MTSRDDIYYVELVKEGNVSAYSELVDRYRDFVYGMVLRMVRNPMDAEELAQDAFIKAYNKIGSFRKEAKFATWLYRIAYNETVSFLRKKKVVMTTIEESGMDNIPEAEVQDGMMGLDEKEQKELVKIALGKLNPVDAALVDLFYLGGSSINEICEIMHMSESNVKVRLHRLRKKLYEEMNALLQEKSKLLR